MSPKKIGAVKFMQEHFKPQIEEMITAKEKHRDSEKKLGNDKNANDAHEIAEILSGMLGTNI